MTMHRPPLDVVPATAGMLEALIEDEEAFRKDHDLALAAGYEVFDGSLAHALSVVRAGGDPAWSTHLFIDERDRIVVGVGGYTGPPVDGMVEIGYAIAPDRRNRGYETEAARQLVGAPLGCGCGMARSYLRSPSSDERGLSELDLDVGEGSGLICGRMEPSRSTGIGASVCFGVEIDGEEACLCDERQLLHVECWVV